MNVLQKSYSDYLQILTDYEAPYAFIDLDYLDKNIADILKRAGSLKIRIASKSIRSVEILRYIFSKSEQFEGIMSFTTKESLFLLQQGFDNILLGYPSVTTSEIESLALEISKGKKVQLMVDKQEHVRLINSIGSKLNVVIPICIDLDMSSSFPGIHFGVMRSAIDNKEKLKLLLDEIKQNPFVLLNGLMGYEAQIAGLGDNVKGAGLMNTVIRFLKKQSIKEIAKRRKDCVQLIQDEGFDLQLVNGGGTGSIESTKNEPWVNEVTVGSGFYSPLLFDNYQNFKHLPAAAFALRVVRKPTDKIVTCLGGGYLASGAIDKLRLPQAYLPEGLKLTKNEGAGEVQTPLLQSTQNLQVGDTVFFRHSKSGELCERFNDLILIKNGKVEKLIKTYRGDQQCFL